MKGNLKVIGFAPKRFLERDVDKKKRRQWTSAEKVKLLKRHLLERVPVSKVCEEADVAPSLFHRWQEQLFHHAALALEADRAAARRPEQQQIDKLEDKIRRKDEVLAELMAEHIALKKECGEL